MSICKHAKSITFPSKDTLIFKTECSQCYITTASQSGIDICLSCFNSSCVLKKHTNHHFKISNHPLVLRICKVIKSTPSDNSNYPLSNLSFNSKENLFVTNILCFECGPVKLEAISNANDLVNRIVMSRDPANILLEKLDDFQTSPKCPHTQNLCQTANNDSDGPLKCSECDLTDSLWLCLSCGARNCGRRNFDGSGGNGHSLVHFENSKHPVVLKLGTLTDDNQGDLFCYKCDDTVTDSKILDHARFFDVYPTMQNVMSTKDLETELNKTYSWISAEDESKLTPLSGPGLVGIANIKNSCYISTILQILISVPNFINTYTKTLKNHREQCKELNPALCINCQMTKFCESIFCLNNDFIIHKLPKNFKNLNNIQIYHLNEKGNDSEILMKTEKVVEKRNSTDIEMLRMALCKNNQYFLSSAQHDCFEFYLHILNTLNTEIAAKAPSFLPKTDNFGTRDFYFDLEARIFCSNCGKLKFTTEVSNSLSIPFTTKTLKNGVKNIKNKKTCCSENNENSTNNKNDNECCSVCNKNFAENSEIYLNDCFEQFSEDCVLKDFDCSFCNTKTEAVRSVRLKSQPKILAVHLKRLSLKNNFVVKNSNELKCEEKINLAQLTEFKKAPNDLKAVVEIAKESFDIDSAALLNLTQMGFDRELSKTALFRSNNDLSMAIGILCTLNTTSELTKLTTEEQAEKIPEITHFSEKSEKRIKTDHENSNYKLFGFIKHIGKSASFGHYVAYVEKGNKWVMFNDSKVFEGDKEEVKNAYMLFYRRI